MIFPIFPFRSPIPYLMNAHPYIIMLKLITKTHISLKITNKNDTPFSKNRDILLYISAGLLKAILASSTFINFIILSDSIYLGNGHFSLLANFLFLIQRSKNAGRQIAHIHSIAVTNPPPLNRILL